MAVVAAFETLNMFMWPFKNLFLLLLPLLYLFAFLHVLALLLLLLPHIIDVHGHWTTIIRWVLHTLLPLLVLLPPTWHSSITC